MTPGIFHDATGKRRRFTGRASAALILVVIAAAVAFAFTVALVPAADALHLAFPRDRPLLMSFSGKHHSKGRWLPHRAAPDARSPTTIGFYVPDDSASAYSLKAHLNTLDVVVPATMTLTGPVPRVTTLHDAQLARVLSGAAHRPRVLPMLQNLRGGAWDGQGIAAMITNPQTRRDAASLVAASITKQAADGVLLDLEDLPAGALLHYSAFLADLRAALPHDATLALTVPADASDWPLEALARHADRIILMAYDQHWQGGTPGPIAAQPWFIDRVAVALRRVGRERLTVALGSYAYDWHNHTADALTIEEAWLAAHDSQAPIGFDPASGNTAFSWQDGNSRHTVWMLDAAASWNELVALKRMGIDDLALWRLGSEDPGFWADRASIEAGTLPDLSRIDSQRNIDVEGSGEVLRITAVPAEGRRVVPIDDTSLGTGLITGEQYLRLPTPYVVQRVGALAKTVALTFDDGPDATWTPKILSILEAAHVPATFFVIGENALSHPGLLNRIVADGSEIGNHTYSHPNLANDGPEQTRLELNATQRLVEAYTGRSMRLFRAPYFGDAEPTTGDEIEPALAAQRLGYTVVGLHVDPGDWQRPGVDAIVQRTLAQVASPTADRSMNVVLLHDGGGDRSETVAALPRIIAALKANGYRFVPASALAGEPVSAAMPVISGSDLVAVRTDVAIFIAIAGVVSLIGWLFWVAITLGIARAIIMTALALWQRKQSAAPPAGDYLPSVTVIVPAFNEERVIAASVARILGSNYPGLQIIVADDGSKDRTSAIVAAAFGSDDRVRLLTLVNGGKAAALNRALADARGEVIIALDADTQFEPETIRLLARWFADPAIGAVAGDARVGNRVNLATRWQAIEYITAQNLERRALAGFGAMTVVPGAVGAWRRAALDAVGGYPEDTLAEDQDLTIAIQRAGWRVTFDPHAVAWTEAPESFRGLAKQRFRWAFGTLQCLWKHRAILRSGTPRGLTRIGLPQAWLFQIGFAAISPLIDLALLLSIATTAWQVWQHGLAQTEGTLQLMATYWCAFTTIDVVCGWVAYRLDGRGIRYPALLLVAQRLLYRQIMYWVVLRAIGAALSGGTVAWGKLDRTGRVTISPQAPAAAPLPLAA